MKQAEFYEHAEGLRQAITGAIGVYLAKQKIKFSAEAFIEETASDIEDLSKNALFYGAEVFPEPS